MQSAKSPLNSLLLEAGLKMHFSCSNPIFQHVLWKRSGDFIYYHRQRKKGMGSIMVPAKDNAGNAHHSVLPWQMAIMDLFGNNTVPVAEFH